MSFPISTVSGRPDWHTLPVAKIIHYPLEQADFKPFAQARLAYSEEEGFYVRLWAFDVSPACEAEEGTRGILQDDCLTLVFSPSPDGNSPFLLLTFNARGVCFFRLADRDKGILQETHTFPSAEVFSSDDLQGGYWGVEFLIPIEFLSGLYGGQALKGLTSVYGNIYKHKEGAQAHFGSFFPCTDADYTVENLKNTGEFTIVPY